MNIRGDLILQLNLCGILPTITTLRISSPTTNSKLYFDCIHPATSLSGRPQRYGQNRTNIEYDEFGYNFTKSLLETREYVDRNTSMVYARLEDDTEIGRETKDWCEPPSGYNFFVDMLNGI